MLMTPLLSGAIAAPPLLAFLASAGLITAGVGMAVTETATPRVPGSPPAISPAAVAQPAADVFAPIPATVLAQIPAGRRPSSGQGVPYIWPVSPEPAVRRGFEQPRFQWSSGHRGVDLLAAVGQPVLSASDGVVAFSGVVARRGVITVRHTGGIRTTYEPVDERLRARTPVQRGTRIGVVSPSAGHCVPLTCLHWGAIAGRTYRDPLSLLGVGSPILLPLK